MRAKRSTGQSKTEEGAAQKPRPKCNPAKALDAGDGRFKSIFDESPIGIELYDADGRLMDANLACLRIFGVADVAQVKGFKLFEDPNLPGEVKAKLRRGKPVRYEAPFDFEKVKELRLYETAKSGIIHLDVRITPVGVKRKIPPQGYLVQVQDITERKQTEEMLRYHAEELAALQATTLDLAAQQDLLSLLNTVVERAMALLDSPCGFIYLHDAKTNELELVVEHGLYATPGLRLRMGEGMAGRVAQNRKSLVIDDYSTWEGRSPHYAAVPYYAVVEVPMLFGGQLIGILGVNETAATRKYNEADVRLLSLFAGQAASAVRNARLFQGLQAELAERKRTEQALLQTERRYRTLFELSPDGILLIDPETEFPIVFNSAAHHQLGYSREEFARLRIKDYEIIEKPEVTEAHIKKIIQEGRDDFETKHRTKQGEIRNVHVTVQTIELAGRPALNSIFRDITARKQVEERLRQRVEELAALQATVLEITAPHDLPTLLRTIVERAALLINAPSGGMYLCDAEKKEVRCVVSYNTPGDYTGTVLKYGEGAAGVVAGTSEPLIIDDYRSWRKRADVFEEKQPFSAVLSVPMIWQNQATGVIHVLHYEKGRRFTQADLELLTLFANHAAIAVENARLYEAAQQELAERKRAEEALRQRVEELAALQATVLDLAAQQDLLSLLHTIVERAMALLHAPSGFIYLYDAARDDLEMIVTQNFPAPIGTRLQMGKGMAGQVAQTRQPLIVDDYSAWEGRSPIFADTPYHAIVEVPMLFSGQLIGVLGVNDTVETALKFTQADARLLSLFAGQAASAVHNARLVQGLQSELTERKRVEKVQAAIYRISQMAVSSESLDEFYASLHHILGDLMPVENYYIAMYDPDSNLLSFPYFVDQYDQPLQPTKARRGLTEYVLRTGQPLLASPEVFDQLVQQGEVELVGTNSVDWLGVPLKVKGKVIGVMVTQSYTEGIRFSQADSDMFTFVSTQVAMAIERIRLYAAEKRRAARLIEILQLSMKLVTSYEKNAMLNHLVARAAEIMESATCTVMLIDIVANEAVLAAQIGLPEGTAKELRVPLALPIIQRILETGEPLILSDINHQAPEMRKVLVRPDIQAFFAYPMALESRVIGIITFSKLTTYSPSAEEIAACQLLAERVAIAHENARLFEETNRSLRQVQSLHTIDITIASSFDLRLTLNILLEQTRTQLGVDAVDILVYNPHTQVLDYAAGIGFRTTALQGTHLRLGQGYAGIAGLERKTVHVSNLRERKTDFLRSPNFSAEDFETYFGLPLIAKGQIKGVLEAYHRSPLKPDQIWTDFLETLAKQAAIAIDNATLFSDLQSSNTELTLAYDTTLTGWSKALDLRDKETKGHTQRVVETTIRLARAMGVFEGELTNVRRGALLHDIGKMGIPDEILHKPGPLSAEEWATMRQHPIHAREMLSPIAYLRPALDIPYNHHEKWDGSGYPNGLKGEQIPLAVRIFTVVDVFDALTSDRPYRLTWPREKALDYIREQAGKHFDPAVVEMFLKIVDSIKPL